MFECTFNVAILKKIVDALQVIVKTGNLDVNSEMMDLQAMDGTHIALVSLYLRPSRLDDFRCDEAMSLGIDFEALGKILKTAGNDYTCFLSAKTENSENVADVLNIRIANPSESRVSTFVLKLVLVDSDRTAIAESDYDANVTMSSQEFQRIVRDFSAFDSESIHLDIEKESVTFSVKGDGNVEGSITLHAAESANDANNVEIDLRQPVSLAFPLRYFRDFTKATPLNSKVSITMTDAAPIIISYEFGDGLGKISYYLAPRGSESDDEYSDEEEMESEEEDITAKTELNDDYENAL
ncbi:hypothetical protein PCE1_003198 [Barthelona sp. PCE]